MYTIEKFRFSINWNLKFLWKSSTHYLIIFEGQELYLLSVWDNLRVSPIISVLSGNIWIPLAPFCSKCNEALKQKWEKESMKPNTLVLVLPVTGNTQSSLHWFWYKLALDYSNNCRIKFTFNSNQFTYKKRNTRSYVYTLLKNIRITVLKDF